MQRPLEPDLDQEITKDIEETNAQLAADEATYGDDESIVDDTEDDDSAPSARYDITAYGIDFDIEGLCRRLRAGEVFIPPFQRDFTWSLREASRFVESLLLGLPVPGVFLSQEQDGRLLVIDGQQRLKTLLFYYEGKFNPRPTVQSSRTFRLVQINDPFNKKAYKDLSEVDRRNLDNTVIHATVIKQESPPDDDTSIYHIYDRLNTGGRRLYPQEMRCAIYHGGLIELLAQLNESEPWRAAFGKKSRHLKDQELILRFLALFHRSAEYKRPMSDFMSAFAASFRNPDGPFKESNSRLFSTTVEYLSSAVGEQIFRPGGSFNAAVFDSTMVGLARRGYATVPDKAKIAEAYQRLIKDADYVQAVSRSTADKEFVTRRLDKATAFFANV
jgi:hypothetical protein